MLMAYCGSARLWNESNCDNAKFVCTVPGPMFYIPVDQQIDVVWINQINGTGLNWAENDGNCYDVNNTMEHCNIDAKLQSSQECTFFSPENIRYNSTRKVRISPERVPISPHMHGLQNRPIFDGNPLSWFSNLNDKGIGFQTLNSHNYFNLFNQTIHTFLQSSNISYLLYKNIQIHHVLTSQPPGMCFYHDHALHQTMANNFKGLSGVFILYNETLQKDYPKGNEQIIVIFSFHNQGDVRDTKQLNQTQNIYLSPLGETMFVKGKNEQLYRNMSYRFRILNGHYDSSYTNISFATFYKSNTDSMGNNVNMEVQPPLAEDNPSKFIQDMHLINFTVIGFDSILLDRVIKNIDRFSLASAQRMEIVIKFDTIPQNITKVYLICFDGADVLQYYVVKIIFQLSSKIVQNKYKDPTDLNKIDLKFTDLSLIPKANISNIRSRAILSRPIEQLFTINFHPDFDKAGTQNPKIGSIEDWHIVNTVKEVHPIHFHLVNFQQVKQYSLKIIPEGCTLFELDFFRDTNISQFQIQNNIELCNYLNNLTMDDIVPVIDIFNSLNLQNQFATIDGQLVSGKYVLQQITNQTNITSYLIDNCTLGNTYKYICQDRTDKILPWNKRWSETVGVTGFNVFVLRVRWASTLYDPTVQTYPYFSYDQDVMMQFPGFVYHCHILPHQENMMMRPIMLQPSDHYLSLLQTNIPRSECSGSNWLQNYQCINKKLNC